MMIQGTCFRLKTVFALMVASVGLLNSCKEDDDAELISRVQLVNTSEKLGGLDLYINNSKVTGNALNYAEASGYLQIKAGSSTADIRAGSDVKDGLITTFDYGKNYTLYVLSSDSTNNIIATSDYSTVPSSGNSKFRFINLSSSIKAVSVKLDDSVSIADSLISGNLTDFKVILAGKHNIKFTSKLDSTITTNTDFTFQDGKIYSVYFSSITNGLKFVNHK